MPKFGWGADLAMPNFQMDSITLDRWALMIREELARESYPGVDLQIAIEHQLHRNIVLQIVAYLNAKVHEERTEETVLRYPADWWQATRERWLPAWWLRRRPVRYVEKKVTTRIQTVKVCPHLVLDRTHKHFDWLKQDAEAERIEQTELCYGLRAFVARLCHDPYLSRMIAPEVQRMAEELLRG